MKLLKENRVAGYTTQSYKGQQTRQDSKSTGRKAKTYKRDYTSNSNTFAQQNNQLNAETTYRKYKCIYLTRGRHLEYST